MQSPCTPFAATGDATVGGKATLASAEVTGDASVGGGLEVGGGLAAAGLLRVGAATVLSRVEVPAGAAVAVPCSHTYVQIVPPAAAAAEGEGGAKKAAAGPGSHANVLRLCTAGKATAGQIIVLQNKSASPTAGALKLPAGRTAMLLFDGEAWNALHFTASALSLHV